MEDERRRSAEQPVASSAGPADVIRIGAPRLRSAEQPASSLNRDAQPALNVHSAVNAKRRRWRLFALQRVSEDSVEQPVVLHSVEKPVVLTKCWLCARQHPFETLKPLSTTSISKTVQRLLADRYFGNAVPLICAACDVFITTAVKNAPWALTTEVGQKLLSSAEAFANRDYHGRPVDTAGHWHQGVAMQRTCRWEPWFGTTAEKTSTAVTQHAGQPEQQLQCVLENYRVGLPGDRHTPPRAAQPRSKRTPRTAARNQLLRHLFAKHNITNFKKPFYLLMTMKLLHLEWGSHAEHVLRQSWSTAWGGGKILNALLFEGERIVPEDVADMRKKARNECYYRSCKANELFAAILLHSSFGNALLQIGSENVCSELQKPTVRLQRFFYKLCELRKVNNARRGVYYKTFKTPEARKEWLQKHHNEGAAVVKPIW